MKHMVRIAAALALAVAAPSALAQAYPSKVIRLIVPFPPGGTTDILARAHRAEAGPRPRHSRSSSRTSRAPAATSARTSSPRPQPDGYTILVGSLGARDQSGSSAKVPYDARRRTSRRSRCRVVEPNIFVACPSLQVPASAISSPLAKAKPGALKYARLRQRQHRPSCRRAASEMAGIDMVHVPYKGGGPAPDRLPRRPGRHLRRIVSTAVAHVKSGKCSRSR